MLFKNNSDMYIMLYKILYGTEDVNIDVTQIALEKMVKDNIIFIPEGDERRGHYFTDPLYKTLKSVYVEDTFSNINYKYDHTKNIYIDIVLNKIYVNDVPDYIKNIWFSNELALAEIHKHLKIDFGSLEHEFPEQLMAVKYLTGDEKVLEIGGNIGRNSLVISYIMNKKNNNQLVSLECDENIFAQLKHNKDINSLDFFIENSALSKRKLIQKGWDTICSEVLLEGYKNVKTITLDELIKKYNIIFDTLILDCEGAFYYILMDMPEILNNIQLIIMENDYWDITHKNYIDNVLKANDFYVEYTEPGGWGPCYHNFFEVWKKIKV